MFQYMTFLPRLSLKKIWNFILIEISFIVSGIVKKPVVWGVPYTITIEPTILCDLKCPQCHTGAGMIIRQNKSIDYEHYRSIINEMKLTTICLILYFQGEPFLHEKIFDMIRFAATSNIFTVTSTNGQHLIGRNPEMIIQSGLDRLIISIDGADQSTYEKYRRGGTLKKLLDGARQLSDLKKKSSSVKPEIIFQFLIFRYNEKQVKDIKRLGKINGTDKIWIKTAQIITPDDGVDLIPQNPGYSRYEIDGRSSLRLKGKLKNRCHRLWRTMVITTDGFVVPCCFDKNANYKLGNLKEQSVLEIWKNQEYMNFRKKILKNRQEINICNNCTEGVKVYI